MYWVLYTLRTAYTEHCVIPRSNFSHYQPVSQACSGHCCNQYSTLPQLKDNQWIKFQFPSHMLSDTSRFPPSRFTASRLTAYRLTTIRSIVSRLIASKSTSTLVWSWPWSVSPKRLIYSFEVHLRVHMASRSASASPNSLDPSVQVFLWIHSISQSWSSSPKMADPCVQVHLWGHPISVSKCISKHTPSWPPFPYSRMDGGFREIKG